MKIKNLVRSVIVSLVYRPSHLLGLQIPERLFRHLHFHGAFRVALPNGRAMRLYSWGNRVENELAWRGWDGHETQERRCWAKLVQDGADILDIGANTATFAITAKALAPNSTVVAFEPLKRIADMATHNVKVSGLDVKIQRSAVSDASGTATIYDPGGANAYSASLDPEFLPGEKDSYEVPVVTIDEFCHANGLTPHLIKLDVEGFEGQALCGAAQVLSQGNCVILCEWLGSSEAHEKAIQLLEQNDYVALDIETLTQTDLRETLGFEDRNVILLHKDRVTDVATLLRA